MTNTANLRCGALALALSAVISGCSDDAMNNAGNNPRAPAAAVAAAPVAAAEESVAALMRRANLAFRENRVVNPAGDNATELFLAVRERAPNQPGLSEALFDIMPLANLAFESALRQRDIAEADRLLTLITRIDDASTFTQTARGNLAKLKARVESEQESIAQADAARAAATSTAKPVATIETPVDTAKPGRSKPVVVATPSKPAPATAPIAAAAKDAESTEARLARSREISAAEIAVRSPAKSALSAPTPIAKVTPEYPAQARSRKVEGFVELEFLVTENGRPEAIRVVRSEPEGLFDRNAVRALMRWKFKPAERNGVPEAATTRTTMNFRQS